MANMRSVLSSHDINNISVTLGGDFVDSNGGLECEPVAINTQYVDSLGFGNKKGMRNCQLAPMR